MKGPQGFAYPVTPQPDEGANWNLSVPLRFRIVTWNMGDSRYTQEQWKNDLLGSWDFINRQDYDVLCLCLQEDSRGKYGHLADAVGSLLQSSFTMVSNSVEGPPEVSGQHFSIRAYLFLRKSIFVNLTSRKNDVCLKRQVFCVKGTAGVSIICPLGGNVFQILLMSSHLPVSPATDDLGYEERIQGVKKSMESVYDQLVDTTIQKRIAFWAGDLNFREGTPVKPGGKPFDQLLYAKSVRPQPFWRDFEEPQVEFPPTCKLAVCKDTQCPICRKQSGEIPTPACYVQESSKGKVKERPPSHCDRIHYRIDGVTAEYSEYRSWGDSQLLQHSDHNLVLASFFVTL